MARKEKNDEVLIFYTPKVKSQLHCGSECSAETFMAIIQTQDQRLDWWSAGWLF